ncbi:hypothetical protein PINS_up003693 [Pythium insidiosum]|nr:hypothetical protein PINS_up003693 [Pythium insidiosum]
MVCVNKKKKSFGEIAGIWYRKVVWAVLLALLLAQYIFAMAGSYYVSENTRSSEAKDSNFVYGCLGLAAVIGFALLFGIIIIANNTKELKDIGSYEHEQRPFAAKYSAYYDEYNFDNRFFFVPRILLAVCTGAVVGVVREPMTQLLLLLGITALYLVLLLLREPNLLRFLYYIGLASVFLKVVLLSLMLILVKDDLFPQSVRDNVSYVIIGINLFIFFLLFLRQAYLIIYKVVRACKNKDKADDDDDDDDDDTYRRRTNEQRNQDRGDARNGRHYERLESGQTPPAAGRTLQKQQTNQRFDNSNIQQRQGEADGQHGDARSYAAGGAGTAVGMGVGAAVAADARQRQQAQQRQSQSANPMSSQRELDPVEQYYGNGRDVSAQAAAGGAVAGAARPSAQKPPQQTWRRNMERRAAEAATAQAIQQQQQSQEQQYQQQQRQDQRQQQQQPSRFEQNHQSYLRFDSEVSSATAPSQSTAGQDVRFNGSQAAAAAVIAGAATAAAVATSQRRSSPRARTVGNSTISGQSDDMFVLRNSTTMTDGESSMSTYQTFDRSGAPVMEFRDTDLDSYTSNDYRGLAATDASFVTVDSYATAGQNNESFMSIDSYASASHNGDVSATQLDRSLLVTSRELDRVNTGNLDRLAGAYLASQGALISFGDDDVDGGDDSIQRISVPAEVTEVVEEIVEVIEDEVDVDGDEVDIDEMNDEDDTDRNSIDIDEDDDDESIDIDNMSVRDNDSMLDAMPAVNADQDSASHIQRVDEIGVHTPRSSARIDRSSFLSAMSAGVERQDSQISVQSDDDLSFYIDGRAASGEAQRQRREQAGPIRL